MTLDGTAATVARPDAQVSWTQINSPSVEALTEFSVESGGFKAETGHASGGTMSFVSKSGTNEFHGDAYEFLRNQDLDAEGFFARHQGRVQTERLRRHRGRAGVDSETIQRPQPDVLLLLLRGLPQSRRRHRTPYTVPPPEFFTGDLHNWVNASGKMIQVYDPSTTTLVNGTYQRTPFPNNQIPQSAIRSGGQSDHAATCSRSRKPNVPGLVPGTSAYVRNNSISYGTSQFPNNKYSIKADQVITSKQKLAFLFSRTREQDLGGGNGTPTLPIPLSGNPGYNRSDVYRLSHDYTHLADLAEPLLRRRQQLAAEPRVVLHLQRRAAERRNSHAVDGLEREGDLHTRTGPTATSIFPSRISPTRPPGAWARPNGSDNIVVEFRDDMTKVHGSHTFKWGYYYNNTHYNGFGLTYIAGSENFSYLNTAIPLDTSQQTGSAFASFLLGQASGYRLDTVAIYCRPVPHPPDVFSGRLARVEAPDTEPGPAV